MKAWMTILDGAMLLVGEEWDGSYPPFFKFFKTPDSPIRFQQIMNKAFRDAGTKLPTNFESKYSVLAATVDNPFWLVRSHDFFRWARGAGFKVPSDVSKELLKVRRSA